MARSLCSGCKTTFTSISSFDMHRTGSYGGPLCNDSGKVIDFKKSERHCLNVDEMVAKGMVQTADGYWATGIFDASWLQGKEQQDGATETADDI